MVRQTVAIYARIRPGRGDGSEAAYPLLFTPSPTQLQAPSGAVFTFNRVFDDKASQEAVYNTVVAPLVTKFCSGINCTLLAYGQTGSGKTWTISGGGKYANRGVIPRAVADIFANVKRNASLAVGADNASTGADAQTPASIAPGSTNFKILVSYVEIYNESVYDLLDERNGDKPIELWERIAVREGAHGELHLKNLRQFEVASEKDVLNLLFLGNVNRMTAETPMNQASSRSHCIFTIHLEHRAPGSDMIRTSKFNLVDLAGSERIFKTPHTLPSGAAGGSSMTPLSTAAGAAAAASPAAAALLRKEGRYINLSLHHLEQVIIALQAQSNRMGGGGHAPRAGTPHSRTGGGGSVFGSVSGDASTPTAGSVSGGGPRGRAPSTDVTSGSSTAHVRGRSVGALSVSGGDSTKPGATSVAGGARAPLPRASSATRLASASRQRPSSASSAGRDAPRVAAGDVSQLGSRRSSMASITSAITASTSGGGGGGQTPRTSLAGRHSLGGSPHGGPGTPSGGSPYVHIPYRNSMLTSVLRDSLGGNCATALISTLNPEPEFIDESISTCRFAVRCGQLANDVTVNESRDAAVSLVLLRQENAKLASQLAVEMRARQAAEARLATVSTPTAFLSLDDSSVSRASVGLASEAAAVGAVAAATAATASPAFRVDAGSHTGSVTVRLPPLDRRLVIEHAAATCVSYAIAPELVEEEEQEAAQQQQQQRGALPPRVMLPASAIIVLAPDGHQLHPPLSPTSASPRRGAASEQAQSPELAAEVALVAQVCRRFALRNMSEAYAAMVVLLDVARRAVSSAAQAASEAERERAATVTVSATVQALRVQCNKLEAALQEADARAAMSAFRVAELQAALDSVSQPARHHHLTPDGDQRTAAELAGATGADQGAADPSTSSEQPRNADSMRQPSAASSPQHDVAAALHGHADGRRSSPTSSSPLKLTSTFSESSAALGRERMPITPESVAQAHAPSGEPLTSMQGRDHAAMMVPRTGSGASLTSASAAPAPAAPLPSTSMSDSALAASPPRASLGVGEARSSPQRSVRHASTGGGADAPRVSTPGGGVDAAWPLRHAHDADRSGGALFDDASVSDAGGSSISVALRRRLGRTSTSSTLVHSWAANSRIPMLRIVAAAMVDLLLAGGIFLKHGRKGSPHLRYVWVDADFWCVHWKAVGTVSPATASATTLAREARMDAARFFSDSMPGGSTTVSGGTSSMRLMAVCAVTPGRRTLVFGRSGSSSSSQPTEADCFSLVAADRTLDLQLQGGPGGGIGLSGSGSSTGGGDGGNGGNGGVIGSPSSHAATQRDKWVAAFRVLTQAIRLAARHYAARRTEDALAKSADVHRAVQECMLSVLEGDADALAAFSSLTAASGLPSAPASLADSDDDAAATPLY